MSELKFVTNNEHTFAPIADFVKQANLNAEQLHALRRKAETNYTGFWSDLALEHIDWHKPFTQSLNETNAPFYKWFEDGKLNVSYNCLDRHVSKHPHKTAIIFESDSGFVKIVSYKELLEQVCRFANGLKQLGVKKGERVVIYMPHSIEAIVAMQACARIGAIHSVVFAGFSAKALADRIADTGAQYIISVWQKRYR